MPADDRAPCNIREVIARRVDGADWLDFKPANAADKLSGHARMWDDGEIAPADTRRVLALCLALCLALAAEAEAEARRLRPDAFGVDRF